MTQAQRQKANRLKKEFVIHNNTQEGCREDRRTGRLYDCQIVEFILLRNGELVSDGNRFRRQAADVRDRIIAKEVGAL